MREDDILPVKKQSKENVLLLMAIYLLLELYKKQVDLTIDEQTLDFCSNKGVEREQLLFMRPINIGLSEEQRQGVVDLLNQDLSDAYLLVIKTKKYHWDVVGPQFRTLHHLWEEHYEAISENIDAYAERVRALGGYPVGTAEGFLKHATLREHPGDLPSANEMVSRLVVDHEHVIRSLREHINQCSEQYGDEGTADFLTGIMEQHEEMSWMLRSFIDGEALKSNGDNASDLKVPAGV